MMRTKGVQSNRLHVFEILTSSKSAYRRYNVLMVLRVSQSYAPDRLDQ